MPVNGTASRVDVAVVGGQAGLAVSCYLRAFGVEHVVLKRGRPGQSWRSVCCDSFTLVMPNWMNRRPGYDLPGLTPSFTIVGGRAVHDPGGLLASPR